MAETRVSYFPTIPPSAPKASSSYSRHLNDAPYAALSGVVTDGRVPEKFQVMPRCRERHQVGQTNRWRLPEALYSDLLGNAQALKAINMPYNSTMVRIITGTHPLPPPKPQEGSWSAFREPPPPEPPDSQKSGYTCTVAKAAKEITSGAWSKKVKEAIRAREEEERRYKKELAAKGE